jgi:hypothetical protein
MVTRRAITVDSRFMCRARTNSGGFYGRAGRSLPGCFAFKSSVAAIAM